MLQDILEEYELRYRKLVDTWNNDSNNKNRPQSNSNNFIIKIGLHIFTGVDFSWFDDQDNWIEDNITLTEIL